MTTPSKTEDDLEIPEFLRVRGPRTSTSRMPEPTTSPPPSFVPEPKKHEDPKVLAFLAQKEEEDRVRTKNRIARMKEKLQVKRDNLEWDPSSGRYLPVGYKERRRQARYEQALADYARVFGPRVTKKNTEKRVAEAETEGEETLSKAQVDKYNALAARLTAAGSPHKKVERFATSKDAERRIAGLEAKLQVLTKPARTEKKQKPVRSRTVGGNGKAKTKEKKSKLGGTWTIACAPRGPYKPCRASSKRAVVINLLAEGRHSLQKIREEADLGTDANAYSTIHCIQRDLGMGAECREDGICRAIFPSGMKASDFVK